MINFFNTEQSNELIFEVFQYLPIKDLVKCRQINKRIKEIAESKFFYNEYLMDIKEAHKKFIEGPKNGLSENTLNGIKLRCEELKKIYQACFKCDLIIYSSFGGIKNYEELPIIDIGDREGETGYIDFIKPKEMQSPIMRGTDKYNRKFFTIRAKHKKSNRFYTQTFFRRYVCQNKWSYGGKNIVPFECGVIFNDNTLEKEALQNLREFLDTKENEYYKIC